MRDATATTSEVVWVEAHGTGTPLGDPTETAALTSALRAPPNHEHELLVGAVKTNIGHLEACAGLAGLHKNLLTLQHLVMPSNLHLRNLNPLVVKAIGRSHITFPTVATAWPKSTVKEVSGVNGVSSFGFGGTISHCIMQPDKEPAQGKLTLIAHLNSFQ